MAEKMRDEIAVENTSFGESSGVELEKAQSTDELLIGEPFNPDEIDVGTRNMTIDLLLSRIESEAIDLQPDFQRRSGIWNQKQQSRLIESLLLRIPLPTLYAAEDKDEDWVIVDGIQRLTTITRFINPTLIAQPPLILEGLEYLGKSFDGKSFEDLPPRFKRRLKETELVVHIIKFGTPEEVKFNIFARINTGGLPLSSQELRHALIPGKARNVLKEFSELEEFKSATDYSIRDERMADREMALRFIAFMLTPAEKYKGDFDKFLSSTMTRINNIPPTRIRKIKTDFREALRTAEEIFGDHAFRKRYAEDRSRLPINKALFESIAVSLAKLTPEQRRKCIRKKKDTSKIIIKLLQDRSFETSISQGTGDISKVRKRFDSVTNALLECIDDQ